MVYGSPIGCPFPKLRKAVSDMGFLELLGIVFIILKLVGVISWSWLWVFSPIWISFILYVIILIIWLALKVIILLFER